MTDIKLNRRGALQGLLAISAAGALASCKDGGSVTSNNKVIGDTEFATFRGFFSDQEVALISALCGTIIPATETPGAVEAGVPQTIQSLASDWADENYRGYWRRGLRDLHSALPMFENLDSRERETLLGDYDAKVFADEIKDKFYRDMKSTIATAYYMSEPGATQELAYEAVPGDFKGCVPLVEYPKAWAT